MAEPSESSSDLGVVPEHVVDAGRFVQLTADELANGLRSLDTGIAGLLESWKGNSANTYRAGWAETKHGAIEVLDALSTIAELLGVNSQTFTDQDQSNSEGFGSLDIKT